MRYVLACWVTMYLLVLWEQPYVNRPCLECFDTIAELLRILRDGNSYILNTAFTAVVRHEIVCVRLTS